MKKTKEIENYKQRKEINQNMILAEMKKVFILMVLISVTYFVGVVCYLYLNKNHLVYLENTIPLDTVHRELVIYETNKFFFKEKLIDVVAIPIAVSSAVLAFKIWVKK